MFAPGVTPTVGDRVTPTRQDRFGGKQVRMPNACPPLDPHQDPYRQLRNGHPSFNEIGQPPMRQDTPSPATERARDVDDGDHDASGPVHRTEKAESTAGQPHRYRAAREASHAARSFEQVI